MAQEWRIEPMASIVPVRSTIGPPGRQILMIEGGHFRCRRCGRLSESGLGPAARNLLGTTDGQARLKCPWCGRRLKWRSVVASPEGGAR